MKAIKDKYKRLTAVCLLLAFLLGFMLMPGAAKADAVTDSISVAVGYTGMSLSDYVVVDTYHWSELEANLPIYEQAYSYYQGGSGTDYVAIVDSARGFSVADFLDYANIYYGDVYNLQFYVTDHNGIQAALDKSTLFAQRYYFDDLPFHLERYYNDETGVLTGYGYDEVWNYAYSVEPMLALEDNWVAFSQEFEHIGPNFESMSAANRFRLLFGQSSPTEVMTSSSAKYVSCVYVTLYGSPVIEDMPELDNSLGSHEVTATMQVDNLDLRNALSEYMRLNSTDESVLRITGVTVDPVPGYSDLAKVKISYDIVGPGSASITADFGGSTSAQAVSSAVQVTATTTPTEPQPQEDGPNNNNNNNNNNNGNSSRPRPHSRPSSRPDTPASNSTTVPASSNSQNTAGSKPETAANSDVAKPTTDPKDTQNAKTDTGAEITPLPDKQDKETVDQTAEIIENDPAKESLLESDAKQLTNGAYALHLSEQTLEYLEELRQNSVLAGEQPALPAVEDVSQVTVQITDNDQKILLWTGIGCILLCLLGAGSEITSFRIRLKKSRLSSL